MMLFSVSCQSKEPSINATVKAVSTQALKPTVNTEMLHYYGIVEADTIKKYAFKTSGLLNTLSVANGDDFESGETLATIDDYEYSLNKNISEEKLSQSKAQVLMLKETLNYYEENYENAKVLLESGGISKSKFDEIKLNYDLKKQEYIQAMAAVKQADLGDDLSQKQVEDTLLKADMDGIVIDIMHETGELISQGYPVVIARSKETKVSCGVTAEERSVLSIGQEVVITVHDENYVGHITSIGLTPDEQTRTYNLEISVDETLTIGQNATIKIPTQSIEGIWLNISLILNDGVDYVYIIEKNRAVRKEVSLGAINGEEVLVHGLTEGDQLVISGQSKLSEGQLVEVKEDNHDEIN